jgi:hypothetical protein
MWRGGRPLLHLRASSPCQLCFCKGGCLIHICCIYVPAPRVSCCAFAKEDALSTNVALLEFFPCFTFEIANSINTPSFLLKGKTFLLSLNQCHYSFNISYLIFSSMTLTPKKSDKIWFTHPSLDHLSYAPLTISYCIAMHHWISYFSWDMIRHLAGFTLL